MNHAFACNCISAGQQSHTWPSPSNSSQQLACCALQTADLKGYRLTDSDIRDVEAAMVFLFP